MRKHKGGDVRGNYEPYQAFYVDDLYEIFLYTHRLTYYINTDDGKEAIFDTIDMEGYELDVEDDETGIFESRDTTNIDEIQEKFDVDIYTLYAKGGKLGIAWQNRNDIDYFSVDVDTEEEQYRDLQFKDYDSALAKYKQVTSKDKYKGEELENVQLLVVFEDGEYHTELSKDYYAKGGNIEVGKTYGAKFMNKFKKRVPTKFEVISKFKGKDNKPMVEILTEDGRRANVFEEDLKPLMYADKEQGGEIEFAKGGKVYYQPKLTDKEFIENDLYSFEVFKSKAKAQKVFPNKEIIEYRGDDIENPTFVDDQFFDKGGTLNLSTKQYDKAFHLPIEMAIYVPSTTDVDKVISDSEMEKRVLEVSTYLSKIFGGYTSQETIGGYVDSKGQLVNEDVVRVVSFGTNEKFLENKSKILKKIASWCTKWNQEAIGFEVEGDLYYIPQNFAKGGKIISYSDIYKVLEELTDSFEEIDNEMNYDVTGEEVEYKSRDGFIPFTDGGFAIRFFDYLDRVYGSGSSLPTKKLNVLKDEFIDMSFDDAKEQFIENNPEIVMELGEEQINYNDLDVNGYFIEAEELDELQMDYMRDESIMYELHAYYYKPDNYNNPIENKNTIKLEGFVNLEAPYHRYNKFPELQDSKRIEFSFDSISELKKKLDKNLKVIIDWFN